MPFESDIMVQEREQEKIYMPITEMAESIYGHEMWTIAEGTKHYWLQRWMR